MVGLDFYIPSTLEDEVEKLGYILERDERAKNFIDWRQEKENAVRSAVAGLERPKVRAMSLELEKMDAYVEARSYEREAKEKEKRGEYGAAIELWKRYAEVKERKGSYFLVSMDISTLHEFATGASYGRKRQNFLWWHRSVQRKSESILSGCS